MAFAALILPGSPANASCGAAYCVLNTDWDLVAAQSAPGRIGLDLRYEFIPQDALYSGSSRISRSDVQEDVVEGKTINRNLSATLDYTITDHWGLAVTLPLVSRSHEHTVDPAGEAAGESWSFVRSGDARLLGRYQTALGEQGSIGLQFGTKLPTGSHQVANGDGTVAERALQPGTGSTDAILGAYYAHRPKFRDTSWFVQAQLQSAIATKDEFRPGSQLSVSAGISQPVADQLSLLLQLNALAKRRDSGANAEPDLSGGRYLFVSPGLSYAINAGSRLYGYVQLPVHRHVNGIQLTADWSLVAGYSLRF
jgi:hypothetical protein